MPVDNNRLFVLSGIASFLLFCMIVLMIAWQAKIVVQPMSYASLQSEVISISLDSPNPVEPKPQTKTSEEVPTIEPVTEPVKEKNAKSTEEKKAQPEITDLFSNVKVTTFSKRKQTKF